MTGLRSCLTRLRRRLRAEEGLSLAEVLVTVTILGLAVVGIASGLGTAAIASDRHRKEVTADTVVRDYAEAVKEYVRLIGYAEEATAAATAAKYSYASVSAATGFRKPDRYDVGLTGDIQFQNSANLNVILVLDTSASIASADAEDDVKDAATLFLRELSGSGAQVALVSFGTQAQLKVAAKPVTADTITSTFTPAINGLSFSGYTNWDDGLATAFSQLGSFGIASPPLVVFVTDGNPNRWVVDDSSPKEVDGESESTAMAEAKKQKSLIEDLYHSRIFAIGVGDLDEANLKAISGTNQFPGTVFDDADWMRVTNFTDLETRLQQVAQNLRKDYFSPTQPSSGDQGTQLLTLYAASDDGRARETLQIMVRRP